MKLLIIAGPPASGKLTVANEIKKKRASFSIFHNHHTVDIYLPILKYGTKEFRDKVTKLRFEIFELAAQKNKNLLFTFVYTPGDELFFKKIEKLLDKYNSNLYIAQLIPKREQLLERVTGSSRKKYEKIVSEERLLARLSENDFYAPISFKNTIVIDNSEMEASEVAKILIKHFKL